LPPGLSQETILEQDGCLLVHVHSPPARATRVKLSDLDGLRWLLPPAGTPTRAAINAVFAKAKRPPPVATVEASSIKVIHATLRGNPRMVSIVPSDAGHDIQSLGSVRRLPFPVPLHMPPIGLISATRHRGTPVVRNLQNVLREILRNRREAA
jgi:DNA-binding transcriptional LysR family regulator